MKIVIVGDGKVGFTLTKLLSKEGHDLVVIDSNSDVLRESQEALDVAVVTGNGARVEVQREADVQHSDVLIAATSSDEINLLCCMVARKLGCRSTIARVRNPAYDSQLRLLKEELGLSLSINPERAAAREIFRLLQFPSFLKRDSFAKGRVELVELKLRHDNALVNRKLSELGGFARLNALICAVDRDGEITIPSGSFELREGDKITIAADAAELANLLRQLNVGAQKAQSVMIVGGSRIAEYLAAMLLRAHVRVTIIEKQRARCETLSEALPEVMVIYGDGSQKDLLLSEGIRQTDALVTLTGMDEENLIISMFGNYIGVPKTITKINRTEYAEVFADKGIDTIVSPKLLTADEIVSYVRAMDNTAGGSVVTLYSIAGGSAEALEFFVKSDAPYLNIPLYQLALKPDILIASIIRARKVILPKGGDSMQKGDTVVVVTPAERAVCDLKDIFVEGAFDAPAPIMLP
ncbi:MAG TPA: Trk system potassium transporter TrkA [Clostridia bacterium]|nr:Trk system potassium transporter TrkA [Clostridia bacterium]HPK14866.1 Trk system potassium transporter TrkA [Clostridia bacterium]